MYKTAWFFRDNTTLEFSSEAERKLIRAKIMRLPGVQCVFQARLFSIYVWDLAILLFSLCCLGRELLFFLILPQYSSSVAPTSHASLTPYMCGFSCRAQFARIPYTLEKFYQKQYNPKNGLVSLSEEWVTRITKNIVRPL